MMIAARILAILVILSVAVSQTQAQHYGHLGSKGPSPCESVWQKPIDSILKAGTGINHPLQTNPMAQAYFNQGLTLFYGFDGEAAMRSFNMATKADPNLAMAHWGIALAAGGDLNLPIDVPCMKLAIEEIGKAAAMAAPDDDRRYINALVTRYDASKDPRQLEVAYMREMKQVAEKLGKTDPDSTTLYAGSLLNLRPWLWWDNAGHVSEEADLAIQALENGLKIHTNHIGLNHYLIHALEETRRADKLAEAAEAAERLAKEAPDITPHLKHMPAHIFFLQRQWDKVIEANKAAVEADERWWMNEKEDRCGPTKVCDETFVGHYYSHDLLFLAVGYALKDQWPDVEENAKKVEANAAKYLDRERGLERYLTTRALMMVRFKKWKEITEEPDPAGTADPLVCANVTLKLKAAIWYFAKSAAYAAIGDKIRTDAYLKAFVQAKSCVQAAGMGWSNNPAIDILDVAHWDLLERIAQSRGETGSAKWFGKLAEEAQAQLTYDEPPGWYLSIQ